MSERVILTGLILLASNFSENDRRLVILTRERGKITAFARGARRPGSALLGASLPFCFGRFTLYEGRDAYTLVSADIDYYFEGLRKDLEGASCGFYFMELADYYGRENLDSAVMLNLLYVSLRALENKNLPDRLVRYIYEIRMMVINGEFPPAAAQDRRLSETARFTMQYIMRADLRKLYSFTVEDEVISQIAAVQDQVRSRVIDKKLRTLKVMEEMLG